MSKDYSQSKGQSSLDVLKRSLGFDPDDPNLKVVEIPKGASPSQLADIFIGALDSLLEIAKAETEPDTAPVTHIRAPADISDGLRDVLLSVATEAAVEASHAIVKHGDFNSPHEAWGVLVEEVDELFDEIRAKNGRADQARTEALQVAAVALRYVLMLDLGHGTNGVEAAD